MESAEWKEIEEETPTGYLTKTELLIIEEEFSINQIIDWSKEIKKIIL